MEGAPQVLPKENVMLAYQHKTPFYMPSMFTDINLFQANPSMERYCGGETGWIRRGMEIRAESSCADDNTKPSD